MVSLKFTTEKTSKQLVIIPTIAVDYTNKAKNSIELFFGWLDGILNVIISWHFEVKNNIYEEKRR